MLTPSKGSSPGPDSPATTMSRFFFSPGSDYSNSSPFGALQGDDYMSSSYGAGVTHDQHGFPIFEDPAMSPNRQAWMQEKLQFVEKKWLERVAQLHAIGTKIENNQIFEVSILREPPEIIVGITGYIAVLLGLKPNWKTIRGTLLKESTIFANFVRDVSFSFLSLFISLPLSVSSPPLSLSLPFCLSVSVSLHFLFRFEI
jgi:hypothetical protein